jgi:hypothetical protein
MSMQSNIDTHARPARRLSPEEHAGIRRFDDWRLAGDEYDERYDLTIGQIAFWYIESDDRHATGETWIGVAGGVVYRYAVDKRGPADVWISVELLPIVAEGRDAKYPRAEHLYEFALSASPEGRAMLELLDRVPEAQDRVLDEIDRIADRHEAAARDAILRHHAGHVPDVGIAYVPLSPAIRQMISHPAHPLRQILRDTRPIPWTIWCAAALAGTFYVFGQGMHHIYVFHCGDRGGVVPLERLGEATLRVADELYYRPVDEPEAEAARARLHGADKTCKAAGVALEALAERYLMALAA